MSVISRHRIGTTSGSQGLLEWIESHKHRHHAICMEQERQVEVAMQIAKIDDVDSRMAMLGLLRDAIHLYKNLTELHREMDTVHGAMTKISEDLDAEDDPSTT